MDVTGVAGFVDRLADRGLLYQATADEPLHQHLQQPGRVAYCGFDPTADSLHVGHFIQVQLLRIWQHAGHTPIALVGGGTGLIGDPSGKESERQLLDEEQVRANVEGQRRIFDRLLDFDPASPNPAQLVNNLDWLGKLGYIEVLRDVGKHFSVNMMIQKDSVKNRLAEREQGISYTEFSYMILQAYDFLHLHRTAGCTVQLGGRDQYGNIVTGVDLIRRAVGTEQVYGVTSPLVTRSDGKKMGKTESGAVWLTADRTSPYAFYQYWINTTDADIGAFLKWFTMLETEEIDAVLARHESAPHERHAQRTLAEWMTRLIHGDDELTRVKSASEALFSGDVQSIDAAMLRDVFADVPHTTHSRADLGAGISLVEVLPQTSLASSKREARQFLSDGAVSVNGTKASLQDALTSDDLLEGAMILLRRGRKKWHATRWE